MFKVPSHEGMSYIGGCNKCNNLINYVGQSLLMFKYVNIILFVLRVMYYC